MLIVVRCRVLLTLPLELFSVGHTIFISRGLLDVVPDEATLALLLAHELCHIRRGDSVMAEGALSDDLLLPNEQVLFRVLQFHRDQVAERAADEKAAVLDFYKQKFDSSGIAVQTRYSGNNSIGVHAAHLRQVFSNLLLNAVAAMPDGGKIQARVSARHEWSGQERSGVRVTVADTGSGIGSNVLPQLFERPFTSKSGGHGMGLLLVRNVMQDHKGWLRVRSSTQLRRHGTVFSLFLPAA